MSHASRLRIIGLTFLASILLVAALGFWEAGSAKVQAQDAGQLEEGARLYAENCAVCHGENGEGRVGASLAKDWPSIRPDLRVKSTIENGISGSPMVAWSQANGGPLTSSEIDALVAFILSWEPGGPRVIPPTPTLAPRQSITPVPNVEGDPNNGAVLFSRNCAVCHGEDGQGRVGAALAKDFPSIRPDLTVRNTISNGIPGSAMPAWSQLKGGPLMEAEINDLTAFILALPAASQALEEIPAAAQLPASTWMSGWGGVVLAVLLFIIIVGFSLWVQARRKE